MLLQKALQVLLHISKRAFHGLKALRGMPKALNLHYNAKNIQFRTLQIKYMEQILQPRFLFIRAYNFSSMKPKKKSLLQLHIKINSIKIAHFVSLKK